MTARRSPKEEVIIDASIAAAWLLSDESHPLAEEVLSLLESGTGHVPALWRFELLNVLLVAERRKRINATEIAEALEDIERFPLTEDREPVDSVILALARQHQLSAYDAAYLELAARLRLPLATLDEKLKNAAQAGKIALFEMD